MALYSSWAGLAWIDNWSAVWLYAALFCSATCDRLSAHGGSLSTKRHAMPWPAKSPAGSARKVTLYNPLVFPPIVAGVELQAVRDAAMRIRRVRPPNAYTGNGIRLLDEEVKLRQRAGSK